MTAKHRDKWAVLGAIHLDFTCRLPEEFLTTAADSQIWVDWHVASGGVAGNIAHHLEEAGLRSLFFALPGTGTLAQYAGSLAIQDLERCELVQIPCSEEAGIVALLYVQGTHPRRLVIGPRRAQVDVTRYGHIRDRMLPYQDEVYGLFVDGYLLRRRATEWIGDLESMAADGWKLHLELVPHNIWTELRPADFARLTKICTSISSSLSTIERLFSLEDNSDLGHLDRAARVSGQISALSAWSAELHLRWGPAQGKESELCLEAGTDGACIVWRYAPAARAVSRSAQDRLFVREVTRTVPDEWRAEVGRFPRHEA